MTNQNYLMVNIHQEFRLFIQLVQTKTTTLEHHSKQVLETQQLRICILD